MPGFAADAQAKPGTARLAMLMLQEGTKTRELARRSRIASESLGAPLGVGSSLDRSFLNMNALSGRLAESLDLYADVLLNPDVPGQGTRAPARPDAGHHPAGEGAAARP